MRVEGDKNFFFSSNSSERKINSSSDKSNKIYPQIDRLFHQFYLKPNESIESERKEKTSFHQNEVKLVKKFS